MSNILITGATGFTGGRILSHLAKIYGIKNIAGTGRNFQKAMILEAEGYTMHTGALTDERFIHEELSKYDVIIHCAARSSPWGTFEEFYTDNVLTTKYLMQIPGLKKMIFISTPAMYYNYTDRFDVKESDPLPDKFINHYAATKKMAEDEILDEKYNAVQTIILRPRAIIGAGDTTIMPRLFKAQEEGKLKIIGEGTNYAEFTSVLNLAHACDLAIKADKKITKAIYNIADGEPMQLWPMLQENLKKLGYKKPLKKVPYKLVYMVASIMEYIHRTFKLEEPALTRYSVSILKYTLTLNTDKIRKELGFKPIISTQGSIDEYLKWHKEEKGGK